MRTRSRQGDERLYQDQAFYNGIAFKDSIADYALRTCLTTKLYMYDKKKIGFRCVGGDGEGKGYAWQWYMFYIF